MGAMPHLEHPSLTGVGHLNVHRCHPLSDNVDKFCVHLLMFRGNPQIQESARMSRVQLSNKSTYK
jgi:hypothetical protein